MQERYLCRTDAQTQFPSSVRSDIFVELPIAISSPVGGDISHANPLTPSLSPEGERVSAGRERGPTYPDSPENAPLSRFMPLLTYRVTGFVHQLPLSMSESSTKELVSKSVAAVNLHSDPVTNSLLICAQTLELQATRTGPEWPDEDHAYSGTDADTSGSIRPAAFIHCSDQPQPSKFAQS